MTDQPIKWGDAQQYHAEPQPNYAGPENGVLPTVTLLWMTPDPLGAVAAMAEMYKGNVVRSLAEVTEAMRRKAFDDVQQTHLKAPLEAIKLHFLVEGVDRAFSHQHVRQRTAVYAQESMRFAVLGSLDEATTLPPHLQGTQGGWGGNEDGPEATWATPQERQRAVWDNAIRTTDAAYHHLVETGMPAEEVRGLLPHATSTRLHYVTDMRNLSDHAGNRLCTQAQFHWRMVFAKLMEAIATYTPDFQWVGDETSGFGTGQRTALINEWEDRNRWQFVDLAQSALFRPVCYQLNYCPFQASFDRSCTIRPRVQQKSQAGVPSDRWDQSQYVPDGDAEWVTPEGENERLVFNTVHSPGISVAEWLLDPGAARA